MACAEKSRLLKAYQEMTDIYARTVADLGRFRGTSPCPEYERLQQSSEQARLESETARRALEEHIKEHDC